MKTFRGKRAPTGCSVTVTLSNGDVCAVPPRLDLGNHSPTGFEWGYGGSGPAQLALALLAHVLGNERRALGLYQDFKWAVVANLPSSGWELTEDEILAKVRELIDGEWGDTEPCTHENLGEDLDPDEWNSLRHLAYLSCPDCGASVQLTGPWKP